jgi:hypothetical protein
MKTYPHSIQLNRHGELVVVFLVPKFHLPAHTEKCQKQFSFNLTPHVGRTDGEAPERGWANSNPLSSSTKEMGPGSRRDTLDDHFGDWNYKKVIGLGKSIGRVCLLVVHILFAGASLLRRAKTAVAEAHDQTLAFQEFESSLDDEDSRDLDRWKLEVRAWEADNGLPNPFVSRVSRASVTHPPRTSINILSAPTQNDVRLELAREEAANAQAVGADSFLLVHGSVSPSVWVTIGLDLEEQQ